MIDVNDWDPLANEIFANSLEMSEEGERDAYIERECGADPKLKARVREMLRTYTENQSFLNSPAAGLSAVSAETSMSSDRELADGNAVTVFDAFRSSIPGLARITLRQEDSRHGILPDSDELPANQGCGRYRLDGEIARGGMGAVLCGHDVDLGRAVAVKVLLDSHRQVDELKARFIEEAQIGGQLQHPGITPIYELGQFSDGRPFFAMKLVKGETLESLLAGRNSHADDLASMVGVFEKICQTVSYAHSRGVIHRDLKPANVMVGAFGEVQVMDWGLAKVLASGGVADERKVMQPATEASPDADSRGDESRPASVGSQTRLGSVLGTPAYMSPEQARGEVDHLDERTDVFGLGAILCSILTGAPPYLGESGNEVLRAAASADLEPCLRRLEESDADAELKQLARACLAPRLQDRLRDAAVVARRVSDYVASVQTRLRQAEVNAAAESARADGAIKTAEAERKRRRMSLALAASIIISLTLAGLALQWYTQKEQRRLVANRDRVDDMLDQVYRLRSEAEAATNDRLRRWALVVAEAEKADALLIEGDGEGPVARRTQAVLKEVRAAAAEAESALRREAAERATVAMLEEIRQRKSDATGFGDFGEIASTVANYEAAFKSAGIDILNVTPAEAAIQIRRSPIRDELIAALDAWGMVTPEHLERRSRLFQAAELADDDRWRRHLRRATRSADVTRLKTLAAGREVEGQPPSAVVLLSIGLRKGRQLDSSIELLRSAQLRMPDDFWINLELGRSLSDAGDHRAAIGFTRAAVAARPSNSTALFDLAGHLWLDGDLAEAARIYDRLVRMTPDEFYARAHYAGVLIPLGKYDDAIDQSREAIRINPTHAAGFVRLGQAFEQLGQNEAAIDAFETARRLADSSPDQWLAHDALIRIARNGNDRPKLNRLRDELLALGRDAEKSDRFGTAIDSYRQAVDAAPESALTHYRLGRALMREADLNGAVNSLQTARTLDPQHQPSLQLLEQTRDMQAIASRLEGVIAGTEAASQRERLAAARLAFFRGLYPDTVRLCEQLVTALPKLDAVGAIECRILGAAAAARSSRNAADLEQDTDRQVELRSQSLAWLQEVLDFHLTQVQLADSAKSLQFIETIGPWAESSDFAAIRNLEEIERFPADEREGIRSFWKRIETALAGVRVDYFKQRFRQQPDSAEVVSKLADALLDLHRPQWTVLGPGEMTSDAGATFEQLDDGSTLVSGNNANGDLYRITCDSPLDSVTALRVEALPHDSLPLQGPGRGAHEKHETGNFAGTFSLLARSDNGDPPRLIGFSKAWSDQSHQTYPINADGYWNLGAWQEDRGQGRRHQAVFRLTEAVDSPTQLIVEMRFQADPPYFTNLGRFRLAVTSGSPMDLGGVDNSYLKLAMAYQVAGDDAALIDLMRTVPEVAEVVGDWHADHARWTQAAECYERVESPPSIELLEKRTKVYRRLERLDDAASDWNLLLDRIGGAGGATSERSRRLASILQDSPKVFERLAKLRPDDPQLAVTRGREAIARSDWQTAIQYYEPVIDDCPLGEEWYEYAALLLMCEDTAKYDRLVARILERDPVSDPFVAYCLARTAALGPRMVDHQQVISWANQAVLSERTGWYLHALSLGHMRAGNYTDALHANSQARRSNWSTGAVQIELVAAITHARMDEQDRGKKHLAEAIRLYKQSGYDSAEVVPLPAPDWLEIHILRREAESLLGSTPP